MATALVTGATAGIGHAFVRHLAARGYDLVLVARDIERMTALKGELERQYGVSAEVFAADLSVAADVTRVADRLESVESPVDMLVNNAGFGLHADLLDKSKLDLQRRAFDVMVWAVLELSAAAGRAMKSRGQGNIINVASTSAWIMSGNYSAIKSWVLTFSEALAAELYDTGIKVTALCPGWVHTEFHDRAQIKKTNLPEIVWVDIDVLVSEALRDNDKNKLVSIPTLKWKLAIAVATYGPKGFIRWFSRRLSSSRRKK
ncbi:SDR family NAD(P)-dependent oxidoreductase [Tessaracoccus sp. SD287]|uniref:SDR family NAD(P)-dependent oxidoreductase n=1 Tax=Tessaracoccus sp. SD287 TaxID=2782008 RepID=UPI001A97AE86|nr:SDR family NAD(P)-dependent oxidoreductase [Tessaracoccus sp. SD287]MBO1031840.1 SDR family NAD(P)-dependent oxidoreductase [Tessaracoccus sp. SD287]